MSLNTRVHPLFFSFCLSSSFPDHYVFHPSSFPQTSSSFGHVSFLLPFSFFPHSLRPTNPPQILSPAVFGCWACLPFPSGCWVGHTFIALAPSTFQGWLLQAEHPEKLPRLPPSSFSSTTPASRVANGYLQLTWGGEGSCGFSGKENKERSRQGPRPHHAFPPLVPASLRGTFSAGLEPWKGCRGRKPLPPVPTRKGPGVSPAWIMGPLARPER